MNDQELRKWAIQLVLRNISVGTRFERTIEVAEVLCDWVKHGTIPEVEKQTEEEQRKRWWDFRP